MLCVLVAGLLAPVPGLTGRCTAKKVADGNKGEKEDVRRPCVQGLDNYELVWADEFEGESLNLEKWSFRDLGPRRDAVNVKEAVSLDGEGHLMITTSHRNDRYETGMIATHDTYQPTFGYFECRFKLQKEVGHWSAFWIHSPTMGRWIGDPAKSGTEIDVLEYLGRRGDIAQHTLHWDGYGDHHKSKGKKLEVPGLGKGWHTVSLLWTPEAYTFYVDGKQTWRTETAVSHRSEFMILSCEVGEWAGDIADADLPDSFYVDYVRVFQEKP